MADDKNTALADGAAAAGGTSAEGADKTTDTALKEGASAAGGAEGQEKGKEGGAAPADDKSKTTEKPAEIELKPPEGVEVDAEVMNSIKALAKEKGLTSEQAQKLLDSHVAAQGRFVQNTRDQWAKTQKAWRDELTADSEVGGQKLQESLKQAGLGLKRIGSQKLLDLLNDTGLGNHVEVIRAFARVEKLFAEDKVDGTAGANGKPQGIQEDPFLGIYNNSPDMFRQKEQ